jgi:uncharacterized protein with von Willebrand factor type A (vWA) domain
MDKRTVEFIRALRASGVRISVAESEDALRGVDLVGIFDRDEFKSTLRATLVKEQKDFRAFEFFFPLFFDTNAPPMWDMTQQLSPEQQQMLQQALQSLMGEREALEQLLQQLMQGQQFSREQLDRMAQQTGVEGAFSMYQQGYFSRQAERQIGLDQLRQVIKELLELLREMGMSEETIAEIGQMLQGNLQALREQISNHMGSNIAQNLSEQEREPQRDVQDLPFQNLSEEEVDLVRDEMRRLAARLRSRATLRQKRAKTGDPDPKNTIRANLKYGGVPFEIRHRTRHVKPKLVIICDLSGSMRHMSEFMLTLTYMLQGLVKKARSFIFISDMVEVTDHFKESRPDVAIERVLQENPRGYYTTDLGGSLETFFRNHLDSVDSKTTVIIVGDGRNNYLNPRVDLAQLLARKSRRCIWFCPEPEHLWGTGDSDMLQYAQVAHGVYLVRNLRELSMAIDNILVDG